MKTRFRFVTIIFFGSLLGLFGLFLFSAIERIIKEELFSLNWVAIGALFISILLMGGIVALAKLTKIVTIDQIHNQVIIKHPLLLTTQQFSFNEISGFQWSYLSEYINYKSLKLKVSNGQVYQFSDFEIGNFREFEKFVVNNFELRSGKSWRSVSDKGKQRDFEESRLFDIDQAKQIRIALWIGIFLSPVLIMTLWNRWQRENFNILFIDIVLLLLVIFGFIGMVVKLRRNNKWLESLRNFLFG